MPSDTIRENAIELAWSLWTELGVPGVSRNHAHTVIDPEPLIVATPAIAAGDPRLLEQVYGWCTAHADRISISRLKGLLAVSPERVVSRFSSFSRALRDHGGVRWPVIGHPERWSGPSSRPSPPLPLDRPSLLRFRLRALCGVGARADILCELVSAVETWWSVAELARIGYSKRNVAKVLSELDGTGIVSARKDGNTLHFRLARTSALKELAAAEDLLAPRWQPLLGIVLMLLDLLEHEAEVIAVRRVEANKLRERLAQTCLVLDLDAPPPTRGSAVAWEALLGWASRLTHELNAGNMRAVIRAG